MSDSTDVTVAYHGDMHAETESAGKAGPVVMDASCGCGCTDGEDFGPIDLLATAYGGCVIMSMDVMARQNGFDIAGAKINVSLTMKKAENIHLDTVEATVILPREYTDEQLDILRRGEGFCPVHNSLRTDATTTLKFEVTQPV